MPEKSTNNESQKPAQAVGEVKSINFSANPDHASHAFLVAKLAAAEPTAARVVRTADQVAKPAAPAGTDNKS